MSKRFSAVERAVRGAVKGECGFKAFRLEPESLGIPVRVQMWLSLDWRIHLVSTFAGCAIGAVSEVH